MTRARAVIRMHEMYLHVFVAIYQRFLLAARMPVFFSLFLLDYCSISVNNANPLALCFLHAFCGL